MVWYQKNYFCIQNNKKTDINYIFKRYTIIKIAITAMVQKFGMTGFTLVALKYKNDLPINTNKFIENIFKNDKQPNIIHFFHYIPYLETKDNKNIMFFALNIRKEDSDGKTFFFENELINKFENLIHNSVSVCNDKEFLLINNIVTDALKICIGVNHVCAEYINVIFDSNNFNIDINDPFKSNKIVWFDSDFESSVLKEFLEVLKNDLIEIPSNWDVKVKIEK